jgi:hypothetical protein
MMSSSLNNLTLLEGSEYTDYNSSRSSTPASNVGIRGRRPYSRSLNRPNSSEAGGALVVTSGENDEFPPPAGLMRASSSALGFRNLTSSSQRSIGTINEENEETFSNLFAPSSISIPTSQSIAKNYSNGSDTAVEQPRVSSANLNITASHNRKTRDIGKVLGIPDLGHMGVMPIRSTASRYKDSGQHSMYLRVLTPSDPPGTKPVSVLTVVNDNEEYRKHVIASRDNMQYKNVLELDIIPYSYVLRLSISLVFQCSAK